MSVILLHDTEVLEPNLLLRNVKPIYPVQLKKGHGLINGLEYVNAFQSLLQPDLVLNLSPLVLDQSLEITDRGKSLHTTGTSGDYYNTNYNKSWAAGDKLSLFLIAKTTDASGSFACQRDSTTALWHIYNSTELIFRSGSDFVTIHNSTLSDGTWYSIGISVNLGSTGDVTAYINGAEGSAGIVNLTTNPSAGNVDITIGHRWNGKPSTGFELNGEFLCFYLWRDRLLNAGEHLRLHQDPFQFLESIG